jgi:all-trans-8'-apo-beta-carotenal 15,15'-oxygenase
MGGAQGRSQVLPMTTMNRRDILRYVSGLGAAAAVPGVFGCSDGALEEEPLAAASNELRDRLYPAWERATATGFVGQLRNASEKQYRARVEGRLPRGLQGSLYRNGPGLYDRAGIRKRAVVDGDGMIRRYHFADGRVTFQNRFVRTPKFVEESSAGRFLYDTWTTELPIVPEPASGHNAGVTPVVHDGKLYAFDEVAAPFLLDRNTLETVGPAAHFNEPGWNFKAHTRKDPQRNEWLCFANRYHSGGLASAHHVFDGRGKRVHSRALDLPLPGYMHDFFVTEDWIIYYNQPALLQPEKINELGFAPSLAWVPEAGTHLVLVPRRGDGEPIIIQTEARWMWHSVNAFQQGSEIIADYIGYDTPDHFLFAKDGADPAFYAWMDGRHGDFTHPGKVRRMVIDLTRRSVRQELLLEGNNEFPVVSRAVNGRRHRHTYFIQAAGESQWWDTLVALDTRRGLAKSYHFGAGHFLSEPIHVPDPAEAPSERDAGWLLVPVYEQRRAKSSLAVFQASAVEDGPIAAIRLEDHDPFAFHGYWEQAC